VDWRVLTFTVLLAITTGLLCGAISAFQGSRTGVGALRPEGSDATGTGGRTLRIRSFLVMTEMALAIVLLVGSALLIRTFVALGTVNRGFSSQGVLTLRMALPNTRFADTSDVVQLVRDSVQRMS